MESKRIAQTATALAAAVLFACSVVDSQVPPVPTSAGQIITEDDPRWDCRTMGNRVCGTPDPVSVHPGLRPV